MVTNAGKSSSENELKLSQNDSDTSCTGYESFHVVEFFGSFSTTHIYALVESAMVRGFGFDVTPNAEMRKDAFLFGEAQSRVVVTVSPTNEDHFIDFMIESKVPFSALGHVTKSEFRVDDNSYGFVSDIKKLYDNALENYLKED